MNPREWMLSAFPVQSELVSLELVEASEEGEGLALRVRLVLWEREEGARKITDIKEQEVRLSEELLGDPRLPAFVEGWRLALAEVFATVGSPSAEEKSVHWAMPHDLVDLRVLRLKRPRSADDFCEALLQPSRLGGYLPST